MTINKRAGRSIKKNIAFYIISIILTMLTSMVIVAAASTGHTLTKVVDDFVKDYKACLLYTSPSPRDLSTSRMPSSA